MVYRAVIELSTGVVLLQADNTANSIAGMKVGMHCRDGVCD
jgi:hypothetical protein